MVGLTIRYTDWPCVCRTVQAVRCHVAVDVGRVSQSGTGRLRRRTELPGDRTGTGSVERHRRPQDAQEDDGEEHQTPGSHLGYKTHTGADTTQ